MNPDEPLRTKNLADEEPALMGDTLAGYAWLPRMIDKARASQAGLLGAYFKYPCPIDRHCLLLIQLSSDRFAEIATAANTGDEILRRLAHDGVHLEQLLHFDPVALNEAIHSGDS